MAGMVKMVWTVDLSLYLVQMLGVVFGCPLDFCDVLCLKVLCEDIVRLRRQSADNLKNRQYQR